MWSNPVARTEKFSVAIAAPKLGVEVVDNNGSVFIWKIRPDGAASIKDLRPNDRIIGLQDRLFSEGAALNTGQFRRLLAKTTRPVVLNVERLLSAVEAAQMEAEERDMARLQTGDAGRLGWEVANDDAALVEHHGRYHVVPDEVVVPLDLIPRNVEQVRQREPIEQPASEE